MDEILATDLKGEFVGLTVEEAAVREVNFSAL